LVLEALNPLLSPPLPYKGREGRRRGFEGLYQYPATSYEIDNCEFQ